MRINFDGNLTEFWALQNSNDSVGRQFLIFSLWFAREVRVRVAELHRRTCRAGVRGLHEAENVPGLEADAGDIQVREHLHSLKY